MSDIKLAIIYYSSTGTIQSMADRLAAAGEQSGAEVRLRHVAELAPQEAIDSQDAWKAHRAAVADKPEATADDLVWADAVLFGTPTRFGNVSSQLKQFMDSLGGQWSRGELADKVYAGFTSSATMHGGQESTLLALYNSIHHWGGIVAAPGYTDPLKYADGNPYGVGHVVGGGGEIPLGDTENAALDHLAKRVVGVARKLGS